MESRLATEAAVWVACFGTYSGTLYVVHGVELSVVGPLRFAHLQLLLLCCYYTAAAAAAAVCFSARSPLRTGANIAVVAAEITA